MVRFAMILSLLRTRGDALDLIEVLDEQLSRYKLTLNREKTHLVRFGPGWDGRGRSWVGKLRLPGFHPHQRPRSPGEIPGEEENLPQTLPPGGQSHVRVVPQEPHGRSNGSGES